MKNSGTEALVIDQTTGKPKRIPSGNIGFGIRVDETWNLIDTFSGKLSALQRQDTPAWFLRRYSNRLYTLILLNWEGAST